MLGEVLKRPLERFGFWARHGAEEGGCRVKALRPLPLLRPLRPLLPLRTLRPLRPLPLLRPLRPLLPLRTLQPLRTLLFLRPLTPPLGDYLTTTRPTLPAVTHGPSTPCRHARPHVSSDPNLSPGHSPT